MAKRRWEELVQLFNAVLEQAPEERAAFLDAACAGSGETRAELDSLLSAFEADPDFLDTAAPLASRPARAPTAYVAGETLGPYRVVRPLAAGGMGEVVLAERADGAFAQQVAIKLTPSGGEALRRRFLREREILAGLDHPHICKLLDGGMADDGRLWFAMPFIEGAQTLEEYCQRRALGLEERVQLFRQACSAVHFAHQNLVVHADLKPANILVNAAGEVNLVDFGIARMLDTGRAGSTTTLHSGQARPLTPEYASPEQIRGESPTTVSDIYSLGVVLYRLLAEQPPYQFQSGTPEEVLHLVSETDPTRPSLAATAPRLQQKLQGDLDNIVLKAMDKQPDRRYGSAAALAEDLQRWLDGQPVQARAATTAYQLSKFVRRHTAAVVAAGIALGVLLAFTVGMTLAAQRIQREAQTAATERDRAEAVASFLSQILLEADPVKTNAATSVEELIQRGYEKLQADTEMGPAERAAILGVIASAFFTLGEYERSREAAELALAPLAKGATPTQGYFEAAHTLTEVHLRLQRTEPGRVAAEQTLALIAALPDTPIAQRSRALNNRAILHQWSGEYDESIALMTQVIAMNRKRVAEKDFDLSNLGIELSNLAGMYVHKGKALPTEQRPAIAARALPLVREALEIHTGLYGAEHARIAFTLNTLGKVQLLAGDLTAAATSFERALELAVSKLGDRHPFLAFAGNYLGETRLAQDKPAAALQALETALQVAEATLPADNEMRLLLGKNLQQTRRALGITEAAPQTGVPAESPE